ncbi:unnamed protein product [Pleuronectes platessa]|uniref:Uncharacterized protein n=1 Tax=Pleuronectes platessa TaxID=8262 RepID=A0A9N7TMS7_PLEPL|nr:unnamed protein product [Pleuronectes platessa]
MEEERNNKSSGYTPPPQQRPPRGGTHLSRDVLRDRPEEAGRRLEPPADSAASTTSDKTDGQMDGLGVRGDRCWRTSRGPSAAGGGSSGFKKLFPRPINTKQTRRRGVEIRAERRGGEQEVAVRRPVTSSLQSTSSVVKHDDITEGRQRLSSPEQDGAARSDTRGRETLLSQNTQIHRGRGESEGRARGERGASEEASTCRTQITRLSPGGLSQAACTTCHILLTYTQIIQRGPDSTQGGTIQENGRCNKLQMNGAVVLKNKQSEVMMWEEGRRDDEIRKQNVKKRQRKDRMFQRG